MGGQSIYNCGRQGDGRYSEVQARHYALRYLRVRDQAEKICFVPTHLQKADCLTKSVCSVGQRHLALRHCSSPVFETACDLSGEDVFLSGALFW